MKYTILSLSLLLAVCFTAKRVNAQVSVGISVHIAPPAIPVYEQPPCPVDGYIWIPGYWAYNDDSDGYFWVPGYWEAPPQVGFLWTPGYWGYVG
ncbi:MAG TPA: YXWGXW repeat-containing protein, partial [Puia sp.]|nr:YXWGXW repeat-containing protein [Puia sp.]